MKIGKWCLFLCGERMLKKRKLLVGKSLYKLSKYLTFAIVFGGREQIPLKFASDEHE